MSATHFTARQVGSQTDGHSKSRKLGLALKAGLTQIVTLVGLG